MRKIAFKIIEIKSAKKPAVTRPPTKYFMDTHINNKQLYLLCTDVLPLKIQVALSLIFQGSSKPNVTVQLDSPYMIS